MIKEAMKQGKNVYGINVVVQDSCILKAARAFLVFKAVEEKGDHRLRTQRTGCGRRKVR